MHDLDVVEKVTRAYLHTDRASPLWRQVEEDFRRIAADPHTILYLVTAAKALRGGQATNRETRMLVDLVVDLSDYVANHLANGHDPTRDYLLIQARKVLVRHRT